MSDFVPQILLRARTQKTLRTLRHHLRQLLTLGIEQSLTPKDVLRLFDRAAKETAGEVGQ